MAHPPLTLREAMRTRAGVALLLLSLLTFVYSLLMFGRFRYGLWAMGLVAGSYLVYRLLAVLDSLADAARRFAAVREHEAGIDEAGFGEADRREPAGERER